MKNALESQGGVVNTYVSIIDVDMAKQPALLGQLKSCSMSQFNNCRSSCIKIIRCHERFEILN